MPARRECVPSHAGDVNLSTIECEESGNTDINEFEEEIVNSVMESEEVFSPLLEPDDNVSKLESEGVNSTTEFIKVPVEGPMDVSMENVKSDSEVGEVSNLTPTPTPRRLTRIRSQNHLDTNFVYNLSQSSKDADDATVKINFLKQVLSLF